MYNLGVTKFLVLKKKCIFNCSSIDTKIYILYIAHYVNGYFVLRCSYFFFCVQHMADAIHTGKNFYHVTQFHPITVNHICFRYISCHIDNKKSI